MTSAKAAPGQGELFPAWRYHAVFTDSPYELVQAEEQHRGHAIIEQVIADLSDGPLAHLPSGEFTANAAWLMIAAMAQNLLRAAGTLAGRRHARARAATDPPRPGHHRRTGRPPRPGEPHPPPARGLPPRARLAEPRGRNLRPAGRSGLTSPDPVRITTPQGTLTATPIQETPDKPQNRQRQGKHALKAPKNENRGLCS